MSKCFTAEQIDAVLPQTQCGLCNYGGCMPYASAIVNENAAINLCPPGGISTLVKLAELTLQNANPYLANMETKAASIVNIREIECIGCTKCIQACPVDAIIGGAKQMHTILPDLCTGCDLCIPVCPTDCIDVIYVAEPTETIKKQKANVARERYQQRNKRLTKNTVPEKDELKFTKELQQSVDTRQEAIKAALMRVRQKK